MDFLVLSPPVCTPSEPAAGAYMLTAALRGHGYDAALFDLSLEFFHQVLTDPRFPTPSTVPALNYLRGCVGDYDPMRHRGVTGVLHKRLISFEQEYPGFKLTLMDLQCQGGALDPLALSGALEAGPNPFFDFWPAVLAPVLTAVRPRKVLVSLAYLSQLPAAIDLVRYLRAEGISPIVGGSLPTSLEATGYGMDSLRQVFPEIVTGEGTSLFTRVKDHSLLSRLRLPRLLSEIDYLSSRPVIPLALSSGCFWRKCLFCPDRYQKYQSVPLQAVADFLGDLAAEPLDRKPMIHFLDSALPPGQLRKFLPLARQFDVDFYGFARPTAALAEDGLLEEAAGSGLSMLQLGVESGSGSLLDRFQKGIRPEEAQRVLHIASEAGIRTYLYLLFGLPGETGADRQATLDFIDRNGSAVDFLNLSVFNLPRFSELTSRAPEFDIQIGDFPDDKAIRLYWPFTCGGTSPRDEARRFLRESFHKHPSVRAAVIRTPRWFRAAHLALMAVSRGE